MRASGPDLTAPGNEAPQPPFLARAGWGVALFAGAALLLAFWFARHVLLLAFAGVLLAILLRAPADWIRKRTGLPGGAAVVLVTTLIVGLFVGTFWLRGNAIGDQAAELRERMPEAVARVESQLQQTSLGRAVMDKVPAADDVVPDASTAVSTATGLISRTFGFLTTFVVIAFLGLVLALTPRTYVTGLMRLVPPRRRARAREVLHQLAGTLRWWLVGRLISMTVIGVLTAVGLALLGVPLAIVLALVAALLTFIPNIGPVVSAIPAVLLAFVESSRLALAVVGLYAGIQFVESYILSPVIDKKTIYLPPALTVAAQLAMVLVGGILGVALATPLLAVAVVLIRTLYVEDVLGDHTGAGAS